MTKKNSIPDGPVLPAYDEDSPIGKVRQGAPKPKKNPAPTLMPPPPRD